MNKISSIPQSNFVSQQAEEIKQPKIKKVRKIRSVADFNQRLKDEGFPNVEFFKGEGYFYFMTDGIDIPSIMVKTFSWMTPEQWESELQTALKILKEM